VYGCVAGGLQNVLGALGAEICDYPSHSCQIVPEMASAVFSRTESSVSQVTLNVSVIFLVHISVLQDCFHQLSAGKNVPLRYVQSQAKPQTKVCFYDPAARKFRTSLWSPRGTK